VSDLGSGPAARRAASTRAGVPSAFLT
jgi:hypothetical protein